MSIGNGSRRVLAIGIDAAEATFVRQLIDQDEMPALKSLLGDHQGGRWLRVQSPAHIGSGAVWPTFMTGEDPTAHGVYSEWSWGPDTMSLSRYHGRHLTPFWKPLAQQGIPLGVFDVPFALPVGISRGFEVCEWWAHDSTGAGLQAGPPGVLSVAKQSPVHPLSANRFVNTTPDNQSDLKELTVACVEGVRLRGALAQRLIRETRPMLVADGLSGDSSCEPSDVAHHRARASGLPRARAEWRARAGASAQERIPRRRATDCRPHRCCR